MSNKKDPKSPATTSAAHDCMMPRWVLLETLLGGTEAMRAAGETYAPKYSQETDQNYAARIAGAVLLNMTEQTLENLVGKPFIEEIKVNDDVPPAIVEPILEDVDLQGNSLDVFARRWFREGIAKAFAHVLVDMPRLQPKVEGQPRTLADDRKEGVRPYWSLIKPECVLFAEAQVVEGVEVLMHVRILETYTVRDGFAEVTKVRIRVLEPGLVELWEPHPTKKRDGEPEWFRSDTWATGIDYIPLVTFYANREAFMEGKPPLTDLAWLNVAHWQSTSDQRHILTVARFPMLACSGASGEDGTAVVVGPNQILYNPDPNGKFYYVEHTGAAIEAGRKDLEALEVQMAGYGSQFLKERPGDQTATGRAIDSAEASSDLAAMVVIFEDSIASALQMTADWMKLPEGGTVELVKDYDVAEVDSAGLDTLNKARDRRDISRVAYLEELRLRGLLSEDFDAEEDAQELQDEATEALGAAGIELDPTGKPILPKVDPLTGEPVNQFPGSTPPAGDPNAPKGPAAKKPAAKKPAAKKAPAKKKAIK